MSAVCQGETTLNTNYEWMKFYEAAVLETNREALPQRIEAALNAIGQRVVTLALDEAERRAVVKTLNALAVLKRERRPARVCYQCLDANDLITPLNGKTFIAKTGMGEISVKLHMRCANAWADSNSFQALVPLRRSHAHPIRINF
jgi:hypothetical protein